MIYTDYGIAQTIIACANAWDQRNAVTAAIIAKGIRHASRGIGKAWRATIGVFGPKAGRRMSNA